MVVLHSKRKGQRDLSWECFVLTLGASSISGRRIWKKRLRVKRAPRRGCDLVEGVWFCAIIVLFYTYINILNKQHHCYSEKIKINK